MEENKKLKKLCNENKNVVVAEAAKIFYLNLNFFCNRLNIKITMKVQITFTFVLNFK
jgi:hypothetical protein